MRALYEDQIIVEALGSLPGRFGVRITESVVVVSFASHPWGVTLGPSLRVDLPAVAEVAQLRHHIGQLAVPGIDGAVVLVLSEDPPDLTEFMLRLRVDWPFHFHGGFGVQTDGRIELYSAHGEYRGWRDLLELHETAAVAALRDSPVKNTAREFRVVRCPENQDDFLRGLMRRPNLRRQTSVVTHWLAQDKLDALQAGQLLAALRNVQWRDGLVFWPEFGTNHPSDFSKLYPDNPLSRRPDQQRLNRVAGVMTEVARIAPEGLAGPALAVSAFHAWYAGDGLLARILVEQGLEESPHYPLLLLVEQSLLHGARPSWVDQEYSRLVV